MTRPAAHRLPKYLDELARTLTLAGVPTLAAHPDWQSPAPVMFWMHGRTAYKELDPGRYMRWLRAGIACISIDLPGHGERYDVSMHHPRRTLDILAGALGEVDAVIAAARTMPDAACFDFDRLGIGGMSAGGMVTLRRLCEPHSFRCAAVEGTTGWLDGLYFPSHAEGEASSWGIEHDRSVVAALDASAHLDGFAPLPLLSLHSEADEIVPWPVQREFLDRLRAHYTAGGRDPSLIESTTWPETGAPSEHAGFGRVSNDAKNLQTEFLSRMLVALG
mgnify:CR=1 FL=1